MSLIKSASLADRAALEAFTTGIRQLVEAGHAARALYLLREAALANGHHELHALSDPARLALTIAGWNHLRREAAAAIAHVGGPIEATLTIVGRTHSSPDADQGLLLRVLRTPDGDFRVGITPDHVHDEVRLTGLEGVFAFLRRPYGHDPTGPHAVELGSWLVVAAFVRSVQARSRQDPLPEGVALVLGRDFTPHSRECGYDDLLPVFSCRIEPAPPAGDNAATELVRERKDRRRAQFQAQWERDIAERREIHRLLGLFPLHRTGLRRPVARSWADRLRITCEILGVEQPGPVSWRMSPRQLTDLLRLVAEAKRVPDVAAALDPAHTDRLHAHWLASAEAAHFKLPTPRSMFELELAAGLHAGSSRVQERWQRAGPYDPFGR